jgi:rubrerythrin
MQTEKPEQVQLTIEDVKQPPEPPTPTNSVVNFCHRCGFPHAAQFCPRCGHRHCASCGDG